MLLEKFRWHPGFHRRLFSKLSGEEGTIAKRWCYSYVNILLILKFWIFHNPLGKKLIRKKSLPYSQSSDNYTASKTHQYFVKEPIQNFACAFFLPFSVKFDQKNKIVCLRWSLVHRLFQICWIWEWFLLPVLYLKYLFWANLVQKLKLNV